MSIFGFSVFRKDKTTLIQSPLGYVGDVDASDSGSLPVGATSGETYRVSVTGGTKNFNGTWDANCDPLYTGETFEVGDYIVYNDAGLWEKIDASDIQIVNDLVSTDVDKALSANMGKTLQDTKADIVAGAGGTFTKITYNTQGIVTAGTDANASDVINDSAITGATVKDALDTINSTFALDSEVVHLAGTETITGDKEFQGTNSYTSLTGSTTLELDASNNVIGATKNTAYNKDFGTTAGDVAGIDAGGLGNEEVVLTNASGELTTETENTAHNKNFGFNNGDVPNIETGLDAESVVLTNINKNLVTEAKNTAHNKNFGIAPGDVVEIGADLLPSSNVTTDASGKIITTGGTVSGYSPGHLKGLETSNDVVSPNTVLKIKKGTAKSSDDTTDMILPNDIRKDISSTWNEGDGNGGRAGGAGLDLPLTFNEFVSEDFVTQTKRMTGADYLDSGNTFFGYQFADTYGSPLIFNTTVLSLTTPYDLSNFTYQYNTKNEISFVLTSTVYNTANTAFFNSLGNKLYVIVREEDGSSFRTLILVEFDLSIPFDTRTMTQGSYINLSTVLGIATSAPGIDVARFGNSGNKLYLLSSSDIVYELDTSSPYDALSVSYSGNSIDISGTVSSSYDMRIKDDGSKILFLNFNSSGDDLFEYNFGTNWDITSITFVQSADLSIATSYLTYQFLINPSGTDIYVSNLDGFTYYLYNLGTGWDVSTLSYSTNSYDFSESLILDIGTVNFNDDGTKCMFITNDVSDYNIYSAKLIEPYDLSTVIQSEIKRFEYTPWYSGVILSSTKSLHTPDGEHIYVLYYGEVAEFSASTPWDASTITDTTRRLEVHSGLPSSTPNYHSIAITPDGNNLLAISNDTSVGGTKESYYYTLGTSFNISTANSPSNLAYSAFEEDVRQVLFSNDGEELYLVYYDTTATDYYVARWELSSAYDITNVGSATTNLVVTDLINSIYLNKLESKLYAVYGLGLDEGVVKKYNVIPNDTTLQSNFTYHVFLITKPDGTADIGFDTSVEAVNLLNLGTDYTKYRRIVSVLTDGSSNIKPYFQKGDHFYWDVIVSDVIGTNPGTSAVTATLTTPTGIRTIWNGIVSQSQTDFTGIAGTQIFLLLTSLDQTDTTPSSSARTISVSTNADLDQSESSVIPTNTSSQIRYRVSDSNATTVVGLWTRGWTDKRGKE